METTTFQGLSAEAARNAPSSSLEDIFYLIHHGRPQMNQVLQILRKDLRHLYPEILLSLLVYLAFLKLYPQQWGARGVLPGFPWLPGVVVALIPVAWLLLIARAIHDESLVGDRQFWITRPYRWPNLLVAKALFVLIAIYLPFFLAQCLLLREAGFHPLTYLPGLFFNLLLASAILVLPSAALAAITSNFVRLLLALLLVVLFVLLVAWCSSLLPTTNASSDYVDQISFLVFLSLLIAVIVIQYATRKTAVSRMLLAGLAVTMAGLALFSPDDTSMNLTFPIPPVTAHQPVQIALEPKEPASSPSESSDAREVTLSFPLRLAGIASGTAVKADFAKLVITLPSGERWASHWQGIYKTWPSEQTADTASLKISRALFERIKTIHVKVDISFSLIALQAGKPTRITLPAGSFSIPGGLICSRAGEGLNDLSCRSALRQPPLMRLVTRFSTSCPAGQPTPNDGDTAASWIGTLNTAPADFGITSVWTTSTNFDGFSAGRFDHPQSLCPGSPLSFLPYTETSRSQEQTHDSAILLRDYLAERYLQPD